MSTIDANQVQQLRQQTGAGIMDCKRALTASAGDFTQAVEYLRKKGLAAAHSKEARLASEGAVGSYIHAGGRIGVLVEINCETDFVSRNEQFHQLLRDVAMHIAAANPTYLDRQAVPAAVVAKEQEILSAQVSDEGKPAAVIEKIVAGRLHKFFKEVCLLEQPFVKEPDKSVEQMIAEAVAKIGEKIVVRRFVRFQMGEGLQKRTEDLANEVAKTLAG